MDENFIKAIGLLAATLTTISSFPQVVKVIKTRHTKDLSLPMYWILATGILLWLAYGIFIRDLPLILANVVSFLFVATILFFKIRYK